MVLGLVGALIVFMVVSIWKRFGPDRYRIFVNPGVAGLLLVIALGAGSLGLAHGARGAVWGALLVTAVLVVYAIALLVPLTRRRLLDPRYRTPWPDTLFTAFVAIPLVTVLLEEVTFRGVIYAIVAGTWNAPAAVLVSALLFGIWHADGHNWGTVAFTAVAGLLFGWLRYETGSLLPSFLLHWATNGLAVVASAVAWKLKDRQARPVTSS